MLNIILPVMSLLLLPMFKYYWHLSIMTMLIITMLTITNITNFLYSMMSTSNFFMMDNMSATLIILSVWITTMMLMASYKLSMLNNFPKQFIITCMILLLILILSFSSSSFLMFYVWFEASLIPTMLLIMMWGYQPERFQASMYLMMYTVMASLPLLLMLMKIFSYSKHLYMPLAQFMSFPYEYMPQIMWALMIMAFMVKLPLFSVHLWLPKAHVEAPVAGSMVLAAILLKLGGYGLARTIMTFQFMNKYLSSIMLSVATVGGALTSLICLRQTDLKSLIAYSSIGHMGLMVAGLLSNSKIGFQSALAMMIAHGLSSSAMFCMANISYEITHTRSVTITRGMMTAIPVISLWWFMFCCANMAAPPSINLLSEIFLITSTISQSLVLVMPVAMISFFTAAYSLYLYSSVNHGYMNSLMNSTMSLTPSTNLLLMMHLMPVILIIMKPELIMSWL